MARVERTVFISYRRKDISWALAVYQYLTSHKYDVFFDYTSIPSGDFEQIIVSNIRARAHFVLILTPTALDRCNEPGDWLRREIETAIDEKRNIIPLFFDDFSFGSPTVSEKLTGKLESIKRYNGLEIPPGYFTEAMERLSSRYLGVPLDAVILPVSTEVRKAVKEEQIAVDKALIQKWEEIKELFKPAEEKSDEPLQKKIETTGELPPPGKRERGRFQKSGLRFYGIGVGVLLIVVVGTVAINAWMHQYPGSLITPTRPHQDTETMTPIESSVSSPLATMAVESKTPGSTDSPTPGAPISIPHLPLMSIGGADKIAFVANKEIWLMNVDGSDLEPLTSDGASKTDLQFLDRERLLFISDTAIKYVNVNTGVVDILTSFPADAWVDAFRVSHDGKRVMISLKNEIFVIPFDFEEMRNVDQRSELLELDRCPERKPWSELAIKEALWSSDDQLVAWLFRGTDARNPLRHSLQASVVDITKCDPEDKGQKDNFPALRFSTGSHELTAIDWDGNDQFILNTDERNSGYEGKSSWEEGWGKLYVYDWIKHKLGPSIQLPGEACCYRDARWSPDGKYVFFAFQDYAPNAPTHLYYVPYDGVTASTEFTAIPLREDFFKYPKEAPQLALRPAQ